MKLNTYSVALLAHVAHAAHKPQESQVALQAAPRVHVTLLYEALCPFCQLFFKNQLVPVMRSGLERYVQLEVVPFGNGHVAGHSVECQHGPAECQLNMAHLCAMKVVEKGRAFDALSCMETSQRADRTVVSDWKECLEASELAKIEACMQKEGTSLLKEAASRTEQFAHRYGEIWKAEKQFRGSWSTTSIRSKRHTTLAACCATPLMMSLPSCKQRASSLAKPSCVLEATSRMFVGETRKRLVAVTIQQARAWSASHRPSG